MLESITADRARAAGGLAIVAALGGILLATALDPGFSWTGDALSDLGVREPSALAFNGGLVVGGLFGVGYAIGLWRLADGRLARLAALLFAGSMIAMAGVGAFVSGHPLHLPAALGFYLAVTAVFVVDGLDRRDASTGRTTLGLAPIHVLAWVTWLAGLWPGVSGLALPELVGAVLFAAWVLALGPLAVVGTVDALDRTA